MLNNVKNVIFFIAEENTAQKEGIPLGGYLLNLNCNNYNPNVI
jgi:hypothetical protein